VQPLAHLLGEAYGPRYPNVTLDIAAGGSRVGIEAIHDGTVDIGMASRNLKPGEAEGITQHKIAVDVIAVVVQASNTVQNMTLAELRDIYLGKITHWDALGGEARPILVVIRGENSGTRGAFDAIVLDGEAPAAPNLRIAVTAGDMAAIVGDNPDAIGYVGFGNFEADLIPVAINGVLPAKEAAQDESYQLVRPLLLLTGPLTQPLAHTFIDFALSAEGQRVVEENGWVPAR
jgi:phosphate transport system substrate-binding protein